MTDPFLLLTPILMLGVMALLGFVGCDVIFSLDSPVMTAPLNLVAAIGDNQVILSWEPPEKGFPDVYHVWRGTTLEEYGDTPLGVSETTDYLDLTAMNGNTYYYVVTGRDNDEDKDGPPSAPVEAILTSIFSPASIASKHIWLKAETESYADGDPVGFATDRSGNSFNATSAGTARPTFKSDVVNGHAVYRFDGTSQFLQFSDVLTALTEGEAFFVASLSAPVAVKGGMWTMGTGAPSYLPNQDTNIYDTFGSTIRKGPIVPSIPDFSQFHIYNVSSAAGAWVNRLNGTQLAPAAANTVAWPTTPKIGTNNNLEFYQGDFAEFFLSSAVLAASDRTSLLNYFSSEYGIAVT